MLLKLTLTANQQCPVLKNAANAELQLFKWPINTEIQSVQSDPTC